MKKMIRFNLALTIIAIIFITTTAATTATYSSDSHLLPNPENCRSFYDLQGFYSQTPCSRYCPRDCDGHVVFIETARYLVFCPELTFYNPETLCCDYEWMVHCYHDVYCGGKK